MVMEAAVVVVRKLLKDVVTDILPEAVMMVIKIKVKDTVKMMMITMVDMIMMMMMMMMIMYNV